MMMLSALGSLHATEDCHESVPNSAGQHLDIPKSVAIAERVF
jgi:hypothetical protein